MDLEKNNSKWFQTFGLYCIFYEAGMFSDLRKMFCILYLLGIKKIE